mmetsp:Transcript_95317/g.308795  ORF Transcript_95317/g.308795 Transcript_95317/m.308795 type:complete len:210 (+) Transcript_95317:1414-2043(+)
MKSAKNKRSCSRCMRKKRRTRGRRRKNVRSRRSFSNCTRSKTGKSGRMRRNGGSRMSCRSCTRSSSRKRSKLKRLCTDSRRNANLRRSSRAWRRLSPRCLPSETPCARMRTRTLSRCFGAGALRRSPDHRRPSLRPQHHQHCRNGRSMPRLSTAWAPASRCSRRWWALRRRPFVTQRQLRASPMRLLLTLGSEVVPMRVSGSSAQMESC